MFLNQKKSRFYQFLLIVIASFTCLTYVYGAKKIKFYEGPDLPMEKAAVLSYNAYGLTRMYLVPLAGLDTWAENLKVVPAVLKDIDNQSADAFQKGAFDFLLKPGSHTLTVDIKELLKARMNKMKDRVYFHFLEDLESNNTLAFEAKEGHNYELALGRISAIKLKDTLYIWYFNYLSIIDSKENILVSAPPAGAFVLKLQDKSLIFYDEEILPPKESALLQSVNPNLIITEIIGEMTDGTKLVSELPLLNSTIIMKPGKYRLKAEYNSGSTYSTSDATVEFTAEAGRKYQVKLKFKFMTDGCSLIIE
jgi:hypothetical protein